VKRLVFFLPLVFLFACSSKPKISTPEVSTRPLTKNQKAEEKSDLYISMAENLEKRSKITLATENYKKAIQANQNNYKAHFKLGKLLLKRGFFKEGLASIQKAVSLNKDYTEAYIFLAYYFYNKDRKKLAYRFANKAAKDILFPNQEKIWALKFTLSKDLGLKDNLGEVAIKAFSTVPMSCTNRTSIAFNLASIEIKRPALRAVEQAYKFCKSEEAKSKLSYIKGFVYYKQGEYAVAKELLLKVSSQDNTLNQLLPRLLLSIDKKMEKSY